MSVRARVTFILERLGLSTPERVESVLALLDDNTPSPFRALAASGVPFSAGAGTRQILDYIAPKLGKQRMDRELRDYIMLPLREVGILGIGYADTRTGAITPDYWKPKSPNNVYRLDDEFARLLTLAGSDFESAVEDWESQTEQRTARILSAEAAALAEREDQRLVTITVDLYCANFLSDYEVVFIDDKDSERIPSQFADNVQRLRLPLDLSTRWPDVILNVPDTQRCWVIDCVETDGEVDSVRRHEIQMAFAQRGLHIDGFTTVYRTTRRFAERQSQMDNIAPNTYVWIAETGGAQYLKKTLTELLNGDAG